MLLCTVLNLFGRVGMNPNHPHSPHPPPHPSSLKTVVVTLWGAMAEDKGAEIEAAAGDNPVLAISACRVSSFNGGPSIFSKV